MGAAPDAIYEKFMSLWRGKVVVPRDEIVGTVPLIERIHEEEEVMTSRRGMFMKGFKGKFKGTAAPPPDKTRQTVRHSYFTLVSSALDHLDAWRSSECDYKTNSSRAWWPDHEAISQPTNQHAAECISRDKHLLRSALSRQWCGWCLTVISWVDGRKLTFNKAGSVSLLAVSLVRMSSIVHHDASLFQGDKYKKRN